MWKLRLVFDANIQTHDLVSFYSHKTRDIASYYIYFN